MHSYTPISIDDRCGECELMIKIYRKDVHPVFKNGGRLTQHLEAMKEGEKIKVDKAGYGKIEYIGEGKIQYLEVQGTYKKLGFIAAGTGLTPCFQIVKACAYEKKHGKYDMDISFLSVNRYEDDVLLRKELEEYAKAGVINNLFITATQPKDPEAWGGLKGRPTIETLKETMPPPNGDTVIIFCGPPKFKKDMGKFLTALGHEKNKGYFEL